MRMVMRSRDIYYIVWERDLFDISQSAEFVNKVSLSEMAVNMGKCCRVRAIRMGKLKLEIDSTMLVPKE